MKKSIVKNISLGIACLLGLGASISAFIFTNNVNNQIYEEVHATGEHSHTGWTAWSNSSALPNEAGSYYLTTDVTASTGWAVPSGTVNLCLNDHSITLGNQITVNSGNTLNIYDEGTTSHYFTGYYFNNSNRYGKVDPSDYSTFAGDKGTFTGGYITRPDATDNEDCLIRVNTGGVFNLHSGTLIGVADGLYLAGGTVEISGGNLLGAGNFVVNESGTSNVTFTGGVISANGGHIGRDEGTLNLNLYGGTFTKNSLNSAIKTGSSINIKGSPRVEATTGKYGIYIYEGTLMNLTGSLTDTAHIEVTTQYSPSSPIIITNGWSTKMGDANPADYFVSTSNKTVIEKEGNEVAVKPAYTITYNPNGATTGTAPDSENYVSGRTATIAGNTGNLVKNDLVFGGWNTNVGGTGESYPAGSSMTVTGDVTLYAQFVSHVHNFSYSVSEDGHSIIATCSADNCPLVDNKATMTINAPEDLTYSDSAKVATLTGYDSSIFESNTITYDHSEVINVGTYVASVTSNGKTASVSFTIIQATPSGYEKPTGLVATYGDDLSSVNLPAEWSWKTPTDKVGDAGNREHTAIYTLTDPNYKAVEDTLTVTVNTVDPDIPTNLEATYGDTLSNVSLPAGWAWADSTTNVGDVGTRNFTANYTAVDVNHHNKSNVELTVKVNPATPSYAKPTDLSATYGDALSSVTLPTNWSWKTPTDKVGNAGNNSHTAIYTPDSPNYKAVEDTLTVAVAKANPTYTVPTNIEVPTNTSLASITLPEGFSWMDNTQKTLEVGNETFKAKYTPSDTSNYNVVENIDITVNVKWTMVDPSTSGASVTIDGADEEFTMDISVKVEVKTEISVDQKRTDYAPLADNNFVNKNEDIAAIYDVKLIRTINGVETEIQPSDIKEGTKIIVSMNVPEELVGKDFRLLHIHSQEDITEINKNEFTLSSDGKTLSIEVDRLSEFAFITSTNTDNGFIYNSTPLWAVIGLIIVGILLLIGLYVLYRLIKERKNNKNEVKAMSISAVIPMLVFANTINSVVIIFIVVAALTAIVWTANLVLFATRKKKVAKAPIISDEPIAEEKPSVESEQAQPQDEEETEEEVVTVTDEKGNIFQIRFIKSFTAKLIQSPKETKAYYEELKNEVLSYKKTNSRVSWHYDSINSGRNQVLKFAVRGKTLCVYFPLNANDYVDTKYKVEKVESKKFEEVPCLYRIKNDRRLGYAKDLIKTVCESLGLEKGEEQHESYVLPYEENKPLIARGLIKELKVQVNKTEEQVIESHEDEEGNEVITTQDSKGNVYETRYVKSFLAKLSQADDDTKAYYNELKNFALSYKDVYSRVSWHFDSINVGKKQLLKLGIRRRNFVLYLSLDASKLGKKYKVEEIDSLKYESVSTMYRVNNETTLKYAKELIDRIMRKAHAEKVEELNKDYSLPYEERDALFKKGLIRQVKIKL